MVSRGLQTDCGLSNATLQFCRRSGLPFTYEHVAVSDGECRPRSSWSRAFMSACFLKPKSGSIYISATMTSVQTLRHQLATPSKREKAVRNPLATTVEAQALKTNTNQERKQMFQSGCQSCSSALVFVGRRCLAGQSSTNNLMLCWRLVHAPLLLPSL